MGKHITCYISDDNMLADLLNESIGRGVSKSSIIQSALEAHMDDRMIEIKDKDVLDVMSKYAAEQNLSIEQVALLAFASYMMVMAK